MAFSIQFATRAFIECELGIQKIAMMLGQPPQVSASLSGRGGT